MSEVTELFYNTRVCPECGGHQKNCEHFWAGHIVGQRFAKNRIIELLQEFKDYECVCYKVQELPCLSCTAWDERFEMIREAK